MSTVDLALLILRLVVGLTFAAHGAQKAFGWWQGPGPANWLKAVHQMGFHPPTFFAAASIVNELAGGLALALGFVTPLAAAILIAQSVVIVVKVHWPNGFFSTRGGIEFPLLLGAAAMAIGLMSPGQTSLDALLGLGFEPATRASLALLGFGVGFAALLFPRLVPARVRPPLGRAH
jgi:putative oxidoreductase